MTKKYLIFSLALFAITVNHVSGIKCYSCALSPGENDQRCATDPAHVETSAPIVNCNKKYCTSKRVEFMDPPNKISSMFRSCEDDPDRMNTIEEGDNTITYFRACTTDLCNGGNGKGSGNGGGFENDPGASGVLLVQGIGSDQEKIQSNRILVALVASYTVMFCLLK